MTDVANLAGVSTATVNRVLYNTAKVAPDTRRLVMQAIRDLDYVPNLGARSLALQRTGIVAAILPTLSNSLVADVVQGMSEVFAEKGLHLLVGSTNFSVKKEEALVRAFLARRPEGIYLTGGTHSAAVRKLIKAAEVPVVEGGTLPRRPIDVAVGFSNYDAQYAMTTFVRGKGYGVVGYIGQRIAGSDRALDRHNGYKAAMGSKAATPDLVEEVELTIEEGSRGLGALIERQPALQAIVCSSDVLAIGALLECQRRKISVPDRLAVAGFGDLELASQFVPRLTTVRVPRYEMGRRAAMVLYDRICGSFVTQGAIDLGFEIIERDTA